MTNALRQKAEERLRTSIQETNIPTTPEETAKLLHELRVHQIELEMQNDEVLRVHHELELAHARLFSLFDAAPVGYLTMDSKGQILETNSTATTMLGVGRTDLIGAPLTRFILPEDQDVFYHCRKLLADREATHTWDLRLIRAGAPPFWVHFEATLAPEPSDGAVRLAMIDMTEQKKALLNQQNLERQLELNQRLQSLGVLAGGIAHDFNNLLGGIFGYIELAQDASHETVVIDYLKKAFATMHRTQGLTQQLLTFSKGGAPVQKLGALAPCVMETAQFALSGSNVSCRFDIPPGLWVCSFDPHQMAQVIQNLVINARQAMPEGGTIDLSLQNALLEHPDAPGTKKLPFLKLSIKDAGSGIAASVLPQIFDPFFSTKPKGIGLGLSVCFSIIRRHGGTISVESTPKVGTVFTILLPAVSESLPSQELETSPALHATKGNMGRILVMDDDPTVRDVIEAQLSSLGYSVVATKNGQDALSMFRDELAANRHFTAIFLCLTVPGAWGGAEISDAIRRKSPDLPVFVVSGYSDNPILADPKAFGFTGALSKPFTRSQLLGVLQADAGIVKP